jgi:hypothetical protein
MARGRDGDDKEHMETQRLTGTQSNSIQYNAISMFL